MAKKQAISMSRREKNLRNVNLLMAVIRERIRKDRELLEEGAALRRLLLKG